MALSWISGYNNINYLNQMIRSVEDTLSNDYNNLDNIPIIKIISSTSNPQNIWELKEGMYLIDGIVYVDNNTSYEVSNLFVSMTARLENGKYVLSAFIPFFKGLYEYILKSNSTEYEEHQIVILATHERMLTRYNETPYEPKGDYNPATKKYVDDKANEIITELDRIGVNKETTTSLKEENRIRDIKLQALLNETSDRNISISEDTHYFDMPLSIDGGLVRINKIVGDTLVNVCDQEEPIAITKLYTVENENHIPLQGEYDGKCRPVVYGNTLVNHNADWDGNLQTGVETSASGTEDVQVEGTKGQEVSVVVEGNTVLNHAIGKTSAVVSGVEDLIYSNPAELSNSTNLSVYYPNTSQILKPSTTYTIMYEIKATNSFTVPVNVPLSMFRLTFKLSDGNYNSGGIYGFTGELTTSYQKVNDTFTTTSNITGNYSIEIRNAFTDAIYNLTENTLYVRNLLILEGDHTTNPKYVNSNNGNYVDLTVASDMSSVVEIEGRTMVNVCDQKDPIAITKSYTVENSGNHIALQGEYDGKCRPVIQGNTMVNLANGNYWSAGDATVSKNITDNECNITITSPGSCVVARDVSALKDNTTYTLVFDVNSNFGELQYSYFNGNAFTQGSAGIIDTNDYSNGYTRVVVTRTTTTNCKAIVIGNHVDMSVDKYLNVKNLMIFEGDLTQTPELIPTEYVEGLKNSFEDGYIPNDNLWNINELLKSNVGETTTITNNSIKINNAQSWTKVGLKLYNTLNKTYTLAVKIEGNPRVYYRTEHELTATGNVIIVEDNVNKFYLIKMQFNTDNSLICFEGERNNVVNYNDIVVLEGDWTHLTEEDFNHLGKYKVEYKVTGKNKCTKTTRSTPNNNPQNLRIYHDGLKIGTYTLSFETQTPYSGNNLYAYGNKYLSYGITNNNGKVSATFNVNENNIEAINNKEYGFIWIYRVDGDIDEPLNVQLEEGSTVTSYEPYKEYTKTFYLNSPLLEGDTIEDVNGVATHVKRYEKIVFDGSYNKIQIITNNSNDTHIQFNLYDIYSKTNTNNLICDKFNIESNAGSGAGITNEGITGIHSGVFVIRILSSRLSTRDVVGFQQWLSENPTTVVYELASPIYEPISTESILCDSYVNGHLDFDSAVPIEKVKFLASNINLTYLKDNTQYNIQFGADDNGMIKSIFLSAVDSLRDITVAKGINKISLTTTTISTVNLWINGIGFNASNIVVTEAIDADFDYFEGLSSTYESCYPGGKNLFDEKWRTGYIGDLDGVESSNSTYAITEFISLKPNTTYTFQGYCPRIYMYDGQFNYLGFKQPGAGTLKYQTYTFTTDDKWVYMRLRYVFNSSSVVTNLQELIESKCQLEEGSTATSYEPFIDKYKVDVKVTGKNLFNEQWELGTIDDNSGDNWESSNFIRTDYIGVIPGKTYIFNVNYTANGRCFIYDENKQYLGISKLFTSAVTIPRNGKYIRIRFNYDSMTDDYKTLSCQLEEGTVATSYEPYLESTKTFYLNSPLLEGDKVVTKNGKLYHYHKMGKVIIDPNNIIGEDTGVSGKVRWLLWCHDSIKDVPQREIHSFCNNYPVVAGVDTWGTEGFKEGVSQNASQHKLYLYLEKYSINKSESNRNLLKQELTQNPLEIIYVLDTPYYELIDEDNNTILNIPKNVAHLTHTSAVPVNNTVFTNYKDELNVLEANTQYRVMFDCDKANIPFTITLGGTSQEVISKKGTHSLLITTPSELVDKNLVIDGIGICGIDNIRIFKGNVEYDYVKGLWSGYEERKLENLYVNAWYAANGGIITKSDNSVTLTQGTASNDSMLNLKLNSIELHAGTTYTFIMDIENNWTVSDAIKTQYRFVRLYNDTAHGTLKYAHPLTLRQKVVWSYQFPLDADMSKYRLILYTNRNINGSWTKASNIVILEGDWTDNPPTYEEVMANEGKYAVKVKLDTNATIFGKGGRL